MCTSFQTVIDLHDQPCSLLSPKNPQFGNKDGFGTWSCVVFDPLQAPYPSSITP